jgi:hypothetical protein
MNRTLACIFAKSSPFHDAFAARTPKTEAQNQEKALPWQNNRLKNAFSGMIAGVYSPRKKTHRSELGF